MKKALLVNIISTLLILLFVYASVSKLLNIDRYMFELKNQPFPNWVTPYLAVGILSVEIGISVLLFIDKTRRIGLISSLIMMIAFTGYIALVLTGYFGRTPCSCGGVISKLNWSEHLLFNLFFVSIALAGVILTGGGKASRQIQDIALT